MTDPSNRLPAIAAVAKKFIVSACVVLGYTAFVIQQHYADPAVSASGGVVAAAALASPAPTRLVSGASAVPATAGPRPSATPVPHLAPSAAPATAAPSAAPIPVGQYKDGQYTGPVTDAYWGNVQVQVTIQHGNVTDVQFLDYPHDRRTSVRINNVAVPWLRSEAVQAQTANVQIISGATLTSQAFIQSLGSALNAAH